MGLRFKACIVYHHASNVIKCFPFYTCSCLICIQLEVNVNVITKKFNKFGVLQPFGLKAPSRGTSSKPWYINNDAKLSKTVYLILCDVYKFDMCVDIVFISYWEVRLVWKALHRLSLSESFIVWLNIYTDTHIFLHQVIS